MKWIIFLAALLLLSNLVTAIILTWTNSSRKYWKNQVQQWQKRLRATQEMRDTTARHAEMQAKELTRQLEMITKQDYTLQKLTRVHNLLNIDYDTAKNMLSTQKKDVEHWKRMHKQSADEVERLQKHVK